MEPKITSEDVMNHYASVFGSRRKVLDEWIESDRNKTLMNEVMYTTGTFNILFGKGLTKDMNVVDAWA